MELKIEKTVYKFMCTYVRRIKPDLKWKKLMTKNPGGLFLCMITPSDIAYVLAIIKNGKDLWDQAKKKQVGDPGTSPEKKARPQFSGGEERKRESDISVWNKEWLEFYYTVEKIWTEVYNSKEPFLALINGWENWEPKDKSKKDAIRTYWMRDNEEKKMSSKKNSKNPWWEVEDEGYDTDLDLKAEYDWEDKTIGKIKERLGLDEGTDESDEEGSGKNNDNGDSKIEGDGNNYNNNYGGEKGDDDKKGGGKVVGGIIDESKEESDDDKGHQKHYTKINPQ
jgi:hypothetical protein